MITHSLRDLEAQARSVLHADVWDFVAGGSGTEVTVEANLDAFRRMRITPRVVRDVSSPDPACRLFGVDCAMPVAIAPMAYHKLVHPDGELAVASAAKRAGVPMTMAVFGSVSLEETAAAAGATWFQLYWLRDRGLLVDLVRRAEAAGVDALVLTVDMPRMGRRLRDIRNGFALPAGVTAVNIAASESAPAAQAEELFDSSLSWPDIEWLRSRTRLPLILKGILDPRDAALAASAGVDAVVVSNHGGRQLDGTVPAATALPAVRDTVGERCAVLLDSGVRSGSDVLKALALGATAVLLGRPVLWALAAGGADGVHAALDLIKEELITDLALSGCPDTAAASELVVVTS